MTTQIVESRAAQNQAITSRLFQRESDVIEANATGGTVVQATNRKGKYRSVFTLGSVLPAGIYEIDNIRTSDSFPLSNWWVKLTGVDGEVATAYEIPDPASASDVDSIFTDNHAELSAVPAATSSLKDKLIWLFMLGRNRVLQTSSQQTLKADNGTTNVATAAVSDDGTTAERSEFV